MNECPNGNLEFLTMIEKGSFNEQRAGVIMAGTDLNMPINNPLYGNSYSTTYLYEAVNANNLPAASFLLENGADPNLNNPDLIGDCALWQLQYLDDGQDWETRYEIAKLFFARGANPNLIVDGETLYDYVLFKVYDETPNDDNDWENLLHLYKLIIVYGGGGKALGRERPELKEEINLNRIDEYTVRLYRCEDGYHIEGKLVDGNENVVGLL